MKLRAMTLPLSAAVLALAACSGSDSSAESDAMVESIPTALADADDMAKTAAALERTGVDGIFNGVASYTLLAPTDAAYAKLDDSEALFTDDEARAALAAMLKHQIVPGYLTLQDIASAIEAVPDGKVTMTAMDDTVLTFKEQDGKLVVVSDDGTTAHLGDESISSNASIAIPIDAVLLQP
ncbi:fasciclin domain-containing protein [Altererythrobacter sp.]|uniref:fasciclin domain-containing protein n=1 Tax=Altererythrobacter sp. TaxID=1872480 RepID=UPI003D0672D3